MIPYLQGGESASQSYMNALYSEFDAKLTKMLAGGKSFFLGQDAAMPQKFCGKAFFFTSGQSIYAPRVPGWIDSGGGIARPYDHTQFQTAVSGIDIASVTWDGVNKIAIVPPFDAGLYDGLPTNINITSGMAVGTGLLDWSLQAHYLLHQGEGDDGPAPYYIREKTEDTGIAGIPINIAPEKHCKFALAEIIIEGPTGLIIPAIYDKYSCFRIHNLNPFAIGVEFEDTSVEVSLPPFSCKTIRRDKPSGTGANYRQGYNYFFKFEAGDPRFYWFIPKGFDSASLKAQPDDNGTAVTNSMAANNLTNPAILYDWVNFFIRDLGRGLTFYQTALQNANQYCGWQQDSAVQCDIYSKYKDFFGDPANPATLLGDLIHHRGNILIVRSSKAVNDPISGKPAITFDNVKFNGYATIVSDFTAHQLAVAVNGDGDLEISSTDSANDVYLVPFGTNLFKSGDTHPTCVSLVGQSFIIESAVFEAPDPTSLSATAPQVIFQPDATTATSSKNWLTYDFTAEDYTTSQSASGSPQTTLNWNTTRSTSITVHGIHAISVADVLSLAYWGDPTAASQNGPYMTISSRKMMFTPEGLVIMYTSVQSDNFSQDDGDWMALKKGFPNVRTIPMRGHGFGYFSASNGSRDTGWLSCRDARRQFPDSYVDEVAGVSGADFSVQGDASQSTVSVLGRLVPNRTTPDGRFWSTTPNDFLLKFMENVQQLDAHEFSALFGPADIDGMNSGGAPIVQGDVDPIAMTLLPEMYNGMARAVNALNIASPLSWSCLRWSVFGDVVGLWARANYQNSEGSNWQANSAGQFFRNAWDASTNSPQLFSSKGKVGDFYLISTSGNTNLDGVNSWTAGNLAYFAPTGKWTQQAVGTSGLAPVDFWGLYDGIVPMSMFASFDAGSQYHALCLQLGIPVKGPPELPDGANGFTFDHLRQTDVANGVILDEITAIPTSLNVSGGTATCSIVGTIIHELLSASALIDGVATGTQCKGQWDDSLLVASGQVAGGYTDIGTYWVVPTDMTSAGGNQSALGDLFRGDLVMITQFNGDPGTGMTCLVSIVTMHSLMNKQTGVTNNGYNLNDFYTKGESDFGYGGQGIRWITISDVQAVVEAMGFNFSYLEHCVPMTFLLADEKINPSLLFSSQISRTVTASGPTGLSGPGPFYTPSAVATGFTADARLGVFIRVCTAPDGLWKTWNTLYDQTASSGNIGANVVCDIDPGPGIADLMYAAEGAILFSPGNASIGATATPNVPSGNRQLIGRSVDDTSSDPQYLYIGYGIYAYNPDGGSPFYNQQLSITTGGVGNGEGVASYVSAVQRPQLFLHAFIVQNSAGFNPFPTTVALTGLETWTVVTGWWHSSLDNARTFLDAGFNFGNGAVASGGFAPWSYLSAPASTSLTLHSGLNVISPPSTDALYLLRTNAGAPVVQLS